MGEKTEAFKWSMWGLVILVIFSVVGGGLYAGKRIFRTEIDHQVLTRSHSYQESRKSEIATYEQELASLEKDHTLAATDDEKARIKVQIKAVEKQLAIARSM